jgi:serpin B
MYKKYINFGLIIASSLNLTVACEKCVQPEIEHSDDIKSVDFDVNRFVFDYFNHLRISNPNENVVYSPLSINTAMAMAYVGARKNTKDEIARVFDYPMIEDIGLVLDMHSPVENNNSLWVQDGFKLRKDYIDVCRDIFDAPLNAVDFKANAVDASNQMNALVNKQTHGMIPKFITPSDVDGLNTALLNTVYFKSSWKYSFDKAIKQLFENIDGKSKWVDMMSMQAKPLRYTKNNDFTAVELPYNDDRMSMIVIVENNPLNSVITTERVNQLDNELEYQRDGVTVIMPKFSVSHRHDNGTIILRDMGIDDAFGQNADFSGIVQGASNGEFVISKIIHEAKVDVDEQGTEAAAATMIGMRLTSSLMPQEREPIVFRADKPFTYIIKDNTNGQIAFVGQYVTAE